MLLVSFPGVGQVGIFRSLLAGSVDMSRKGDPGSTIGRDLDGVSRKNVALEEASADLLPVPTAGKSAEGRECGGEAEFVKVARDGFANSPEEVFEVEPGPETRIL